jgi:GxxExxY protein
MMTKEELNKLGTRIIGAAIEVHKELGAGLLESVYEACLAEELRLKGIKVEEQVKLPIVYKGKVLDKYFQADLIVENEIIIELKCVEELKPIHEVQLVTYLKLSNRRLGYLMNFNVTKLTDGLKRKVNRL